MHNKLRESFALNGSFDLIQPYLDLLTELAQQPLTQEVVDYLCEMIMNTKYPVEVRDRHLQVLLNNETTRQFPLKDFFFNAQKKSRRLWYRLQLIRGCALYATEAELNPMMEKFRSAMAKGCDQVDFQELRSDEGLPGLIAAYGYACFTETLQALEDQIAAVRQRMRERLLQMDAAGTPVMRDMDGRPISGREVLEKIEELRKNHPNP